MIMLARQLETARLCLREPRPGDAEQVFAGYGARADVLRFLDWPVQVSVEETRRLLSYETHRWLKGVAWVWMLTCRTSGQVIGQIELKPASLPAETSHVMRLGYVLSPTSQGQGLMQEAVESVLAQAWAVLPHVWRVEAWCDVDNEPSARLLGRAGFVREGLARRALLHPHASPHPRDAWLYAFTRDQLAAPSSAT